MKYSPCPEPECGKLTLGGRCEGHRRSDNRPNSAERGYGARHRKWRQLILARDPICRGCRQQHSTVADHVIPLSHGGSWSMENGQGLCEGCHNHKTVREQRDPGFSRRLKEQGDGWRHA